MTRHPGEAPPRASSQLSPEQAADNLLKRLPAQSRLLVALSGGGDSTGLLAALSAVRWSHPGIDLHSATVDHGLRSGSNEEADAAGRISRKLGVPHVTLKWTGDKPLTGIQAAAREARYGLLASEAQRIAADFIVTGHNREDQAETVFMRGLRKPALPTGMDEAVLVGRKIWVLRPFLEVDRKAIRGYLRERGVTWSEDPSNDNPAFERVRVRQSGMLASDARRHENTPNPYCMSARFVRDRVSLSPGPVAVVGLGECHVDDHPSWAALATLAAIIGGRAHDMASETARAVMDKLAAPADFRMAANRVLFDRRGRVLYLYREERGLGEFTIEPGQSLCWDGRYEIMNKGPSPATISAGKAAMASPPLLEREPNEALPRDVVRRVAASMPRIIRGDATALNVRVVLAPFDRFLPARKLDLANSFAAAFELEQFPLLSLGNSAF